MHDCARCRAPSARFRCTRCHRVWYCSKDCQRAHWKAVHRGACSPGAPSTAAAIAELETAATAAGMETCGQSVAALLRLHTEAGATLPHGTGPVDPQALLDRDASEAVTVEALALSVLVLLHSHGGGEWGAALGMPVLRVFESLGGAPTLRRFVDVMEATRLTGVVGTPPLLASPYALAAVLTRSLDGDLQARAAERLAELVIADPALSSPTVAELFRSEADVALLAWSAAWAAAGHGEAIEAARLHLELFRRLLAAQAARASPQADGRDVGQSDVVFMEFVSAFFKVMAPVLDPQTARLADDAREFGRLYELGLGRVESVVVTTARETLKPEVLLRVRLMALRMRRDGNAQGFRTSLLMLEVLRRCYAAGGPVSVFAAWREGGDAAIERFLGEELDGSCEAHDALLAALGVGLP